MVAFVVAPWATPEQVAAAHTMTRAQFHARFDKLEEIMATTQEQLDSLTDAVQTGVAELKTEIDRLAAIPAGEPVDFTKLQALADSLAADNIPAAPPVEETPVEPAPETPVEP